MKLKKPQVVEPKEAKVKDVEVSEEFDTPVDNSKETFTIKLDSKKLSDRNYDQAVALVQGALGSVKKITIEREYETE